MKTLDVELEKTKSIEKPLPKVFRMDDYSWVCAMNEETATAWYLKTTGVTKEELDIRECDINKEIMYSEISLSDITKILEEDENGDDITLNINKKYGSYFIEETFRDYLENIIKNAGYDSVVGEPFEICSTEE